MDILIVPHNKIPVLFALSRNRLLFFVFLFLLLCTEFLFRDAASFCKISLIILASQHINSPYKSRRLDFSPIFFLHFSHKDMISTIWGMPA